MTNAWPIRAAVSRPTLLQEIAWFLRDYAETLDATPHPRLDGLRRSVDDALQAEIQEQELRKA